ncbi:MAG: cysteine hydrolase family protein [Oceanicaulis sp.]
MMLLGVPVLVCLDLQMEFIAPGRPFADPDGEAVGALCADVIARARQAGWSVVHVQLHQGGPLMAGMGMTQPIPGCEPRPGEVLLRRAGVSAYAHPDLDGILEGALGAKAYLMGFSAGTSLNATLFDAQDRGHDLLLIEDAVGAADVDDWASEENRALCIETARSMRRLVSLAGLPDFADARREAAARA